jgi:hypothetical protein
MRKKTCRAVVFNMANSFPLYSFVMANSNWDSLIVQSSATRMLISISVETGRPDRDTSNGGNLGPDSGFFID